MHQQQALRCSRCTDTEPFTGLTLTITSSILRGPEEVAGNHPQQRLLFLVTAINLAWGFIVIARATEI
jgi:hypothetical protein